MYALLNKNSNNFLTSNGRETDSLLKAAKWDDLDKARQFYSHCLNQSLRGNVYIVNTIDNMPVASNRIVKDVSEYCENDLEPKIPISVLINAIYGCNTRREFLAKKLSDIDKEEQRVLHEIEFNSFNACEGYKKARELKRIRETRRSIKNCRALYDRINNYLNTEKVSPATFIVKQDELREAMLYEDLFAEENEL